MTIGKNIRALRKRKGLNQKQLAKRVGVAQSTLCDWESDTSHPRLNRLRRLARILDVEPSRLFA